MTVNTRKIHVRLHAAAGRRHGDDSVVAGCVLARLSLLFT